jgi:hypothetical protein
MPFADPRARLEHILEAIGEIEGFAAGRTLQDYLSQGWLRLATQRGIEIVSEASRHLADDIKAKHPEIPWRDIAGIGNNPAPRLRRPRACRDLGRGGERPAAAQSRCRGAPARRRQE